MDLCPRPLLILGRVQPQRIALSLPSGHGSPTSTSASSLSEPALPARAKESLETISSLANDAVLQKVPPG